jgi:hypothetical protein
MVGIQIKYGTGDGDTTTIDAVQPDSNTEKVYNLTGVQLSEVAVAAIVASDGDNITCDASPTVQVTRSC